ncbi:hypothetical protein GCM10010994_21920 [Chelatococcus reniformis]|uniref:Uncharacterized protein n=1 Tax=Chelatococcus reniformis TaxID=1494448 RepID=A0A916XD49_9HYPH|nr:hypothetical protein GCM10010994_21920 [Chelatococcus reniformis]
MLDHVGEIERRLVERHSHRLDRLGGAGAREDRKHEQRAWEDTAKAQEREELGQQHDPD